MSTEKKTQKKQTKNSVNEKSKSVNQKAVKNTKKAPQKKSYKSYDKRAVKTGIKIIPLGGMGEIGKNLTVYEYENDIILVDCGMSFPDE